MMIQSLPLWKSCPFRNEVPEYVEIRQGLETGLGLTTALIDPSGLRWVEFAGVPSRDEFKAMLNNLAGVTFDAKHPGEYLRMIRRQAEAVAAGHEISAKDKSLWQERKRLGSQ